ncbi:MAG: type IV secretory system conjugative DNA transfer family protein, partial [Cloacibacillus porcorum]|nr:type IV secretory system conjugative DNA transfer family protein [Cloacibacillus porcorum]
MSKSRLRIESGTFAYPKKAKISPPTVRMIKTIFAVTYSVGASLAQTWYWSRYFRLAIPRSEWLFWGWRTYISLIKRYGFGPDIIFNISIILLLSFAVFTMVYRFFIGGLFLGDKGNIDELLGSAHWATKEEIIRSGLLPSDTFSERLKRWAKRAFSKAIGNKKPSNPGVVLGGWVDSDGKILYLRDAGPKHAIMVAPTRSGKGVGVIIPSLLTWTESALILDIKGKNWLLSAGWRNQNIGPCYRLDFTDPESRCMYNPLKEIHIGTDRETAEVQNIVAIMIDPDSKDEGDHWKESAKTLVTGAVIHELYQAKKENDEPTFENVLNSIIEGESKKTMEKWQRYHHLDKEDPITGFCHPVVFRCSNDIKHRPDDERGSVVSTASARLNLFYDKVINRNTSKSTFSVNDLMNADKPISLYLVVPPSEITRIRPLLRLLVTQIVLGLTRQMIETEKGVSSGHKHKLLLMLDEFPQLKRLEVLESAMAQMGGYGLKAFIICQSYWQLYDIYGKNKTISTNCHFQVLYAPNDEETTDLISRKAGKTTVTVVSDSISGNRFAFARSNQNTSATQHVRDLVTPDEAKRLPGALIRDGKWIESGDLFLFAAGAAPILGKQTPYFFPDGNVLHRRSKIKPPISKIKDKKPTFIEQVHIDNFNEVPTHPHLSEKFLRERENKVLGLIDKA